MPITTILDLTLLLVLVGYLVSGFRSGLIGSLSGIAGLVGGAVAAYFFVPLVGSWVPAAEWRTAATLATAALLLFGGLSLGGAIGRALRPRRARARLHAVDRVFGAGAALTVSALVASMIAFSIGSLGVPVLSPAIASSSVIRTIDSLTPDQVRTLLTQLRSVVVTEGIPRVIEAFNGPAPTLPSMGTDSDALLAAQASVVKITGTAYACGQNQSGSGFVIAPDRVLTNAHVVAGVAEPVVETPDGNARPGQVVYFDPSVDLAVIAVSGLDAPPLPLGDNLAPGSPAVSDGYPFGGPFESGPAEVVAVAPALVADIYGQDPSQRQIYTLAADVQHGESGGPLLSEAGLVSGVIFAKSTVTANLGYALAMEEVDPVVEQAAALRAPVSSGACISE
ncbi:MarP family serine protease [Cryobacterium sp. TMT1-21]|uniref:MarP family serine protease n=1 Tax=Cryobacterium shii TaxID=1259235 RepID=A0AAQ2HFY0_9MICO|nr:MULTISPECIES: MarP family serine protease [Cryobacterium]TFC50123.1 MarP family serine protease [Cryobacterium shii]TFC82474.1 MarP family serine protease [Cryobacterium sp. TmT2-59]TFD12179.1 MarP family serine protease [Cryobacterium sp. TMT1-21]TFD19668.1 MarP family serine protease [Cryobacterium sp. TMT4-10]TFD20620.1 MarP family serine protease [Cryobacterium sp. TMT2-23]